MVEYEDGQYNCDLYPTEEGAVPNSPSYWWPSNFRENPNRPGYGVMICPCHHLCIGKILPWNKAIIDAPGNAKQRNQPD